MAGDPAGTNGPVGPGKVAGRHPGRYAQNQLRTLQRRVKERRARALLRFNDQQFGEDTLAEPGMHPTLRATTSDDWKLIPEATLGST